MPTFTKFMPEYYSCPYCGAKKGERCKSANGSTVPPHRARSQKAKNVREGRPANWKPDKIVPPPAPKARDNIEALLTKIQTNLSAASNALVDLRRKIS